jgi:hypothetical protein
MRDSGASPDLGKYGELMQKNCLFSICLIIMSFLLQKHIILQPAKISKTHTAGKAVDGLQRFCFLTI